MYWKSKFDYVPFQFCTVCYFKANGLLKKNFYRDHEIEFNSIRKEYEILEESILFQFKKRAGSKKRTHSSKIITCEGKVPLLYDQFKSKSYSGSSLELYTLSTLVVHKIFYPDTLYSFQAVMNLISIFPHLWKPYIFLDNVISFLRK